MRDLADLAYIPTENLVIKDRFIRRWLHKEGFSGLKRYVIAAEDKELEAKIAVVEKYNIRVPELVARIEKCHIEDRDFAGLWVPHLSSQKVQGSWAPMLLPPHPRGQVGFHSPSAFAILQGHPQSLHMQWTTACCPTSPRCDIAVSLQSIPWSPDPASLTAGPCVYSRVHFGHCAQSQGPGVRHCACSG